MILHTNIPRLLYAKAVTVYPFILMRPRYRYDTGVRAHERVHLVQQRRWFIYGLGVGLLAWFFLYLLALPVYWNPWRRKWETEAYAAQGMTLGQIQDKLTRKPHYLRKLL